MELFSVCSLHGHVTVLQVKVNLGGRGYIDGDGEFVPGRMLEMVVDGESVHIVSFQNNIVIWILILPAFLLISRWSRTEPFCLSTPQLRPAQHCRIPGLLLC